MARLLPLAVLALLATGAIAFRWEDCGAVGDAFAVSDVSLNPESVRVGSSAVFKVVGVNGAEDARTKQSERVGGGDVEGTSREHGGEEMREGGGAGVSGHGAARPVHFSLPLRGPGAPWPRARSPPPPLPLAPPGARSHSALCRFRAALNLTHGDIDMEVTYHGVRVHTEQDDLCASSACPLPAGGPVVVTLEKGFPLITPPGTYNVTLTGTSGAHQLFCVSVEFAVSYWIDAL